MTSDQSFKSCPVVVSSLEAMTNLPGRVILGCLRAARANVPMFLRGLPIDLMETSGAAGESWTYAPDVFCKEESESEMPGAVKEDIPYHQVGSKDWILEVVGVPGNPKEGSFRKEVFVLLDIAVDYILSLKVGDNIFPTR